MDDNAKLLGAVAGGYLLGRTKQGKRALRIALWLGGAGGGSVAVTLAKQGYNQLAQNPNTAHLVEQVRGPLASAARGALTSALEGTADTLSESLHERTLQLTETGAGPESKGDEQPEEPSGSGAPARRSAQPAGKGTQRASTSSGSSTSTAKSATQSATKQARQTPRKSGSGSSGSGSAQRSARSGSAANTRGRAGR